jgi:hypothetical protein
MRFIAIPILILLVMSQAFSSWFVVMAFRMNRDYIAKNLCENRYRPRLNCNGKCVLMKKLKEAEKKEQDQPASTISLPAIVLSSKSFFVNSIPPVAVAVIHTETDNRTDKPVDRSRPVFQPPRA